MGPSLQTCLLAFLHVWAICYLGYLRISAAAPRPAAAAAAAAALTHTCNIPRGCVPSAINMALTLNDSVL